MLILMLFEACLLCAVAADEANVDVDNNYFDVFVFTQHWPFTTCIDWEHRSNKNSCSRLLFSRFLAYDLRIEKLNFLSFYVYYISLT